MESFLLMALLVTAIFVFAAIAAFLVIGMIDTVRNW